MYQMGKNIVVQVLGGSKQVLDYASDVADAMRQTNTSSGYTATVNGETAKTNDALEDGDFVSLSQAVKGGLI
jgi:sulfur carrier protein ThiS